MIRRWREARLAKLLKELEGVTQEIIKQQRLHVHAGLFPRELDAIGDKAAKIAIKVHKLQVKLSK